jgi:hypothetical protein
MTNEHIAGLEAARTILVKERRELALAMAGRTDRGAREMAVQNRSKFVELQGLVEAIDRAIADEKRLGTPESP